MIASWNVLLVLVVAWVISGSVVPLISSVFGGLLFYFLNLVGFPLNRILTASGVLLLMTMQSFVFQRGYAGLIYEYLPGTFHFGMGCYLWSWLVNPRVSAPGIFYVSLVGGVFLFQAAASVEIFRLNPFVVRCLAVLPLVLTLVQDFRRHSTVWRPGSVLFIGLASLFLGGLCSLAKSTSAYLKKAGLAKDTVVYDFSESEASTSSQKGERSGGDGSVTLPRKADIAVDKETRFFIQVASIEDFLALTRRPLYLRTSTVVIFDGNEKIHPVLKGKWLLDGHDGRNDQITTLPERVSTRTLNYAIVLPKGDTSQIPLIEGTNQIRADEVFHVAEGRYQLAEPFESNWVRFSAIGPQEERSGRIDPIDRSDQSELYLSLPETELTRQIQTLTKQIVRGKTPEVAISEYIQKHCKYALKYQNPKNLTPIENFLFNEKKGHCELFATATVMMLRSAGVPSRIAYGYTGGTSRRDHLAIAFRGTDVHAWAEVLNQSGEWKIFDTTPPRMGLHLGGRPQAEQPGFGIDWKMASFHPGGKQALDLQVQTNFAALISSLSEWAASYFMLALSGVILLGFLAKKLGGKWFFQHSAFPGEISLEIDWPQRIHEERPDFVKEILALGERAGISRKPGTTLREYVKMLQEQGRGEAVLNEAVDYYYGLRYGSGVADARVEKSISQSIRALKLPQ